MDFNNEPSKYSSYSEYIKEWYKNIIEPLFMKELPQNELEGMTKESLIFLIKQIYESNSAIQHHFEDIIKIIQNQSSRSEKMSSKLQFYMRRNRMLERGGDMKGALATMAMGGLSGFAGAAIYDAISDDSGDFDCDCGE